MREVVLLWCLLWLPGLPPKFNAEGSSSDDAKNEDPKTKRRTKKRNDDDEGEDGNSPEALGARKDEDDEHDEGCGPDDDVKKRPAARPGFKLVVSK